jgi:hypothetical protein
MVPRKGSGRSVVVVVVVVAVVVAAGTSGSMALMSTAAYFAASLVTYGQIRGQPWGGSGGPFR